MIFYHQGTEDSQRARSKKKTTIAYKACQTGKDKVNHQLSPRQTGKKYGRMRRANHLSR